MTPIARTLTVGWLSVIVASAQAKEHPWADAPPTCGPKPATAALAAVGHPPAQHNGTAIADHPPTGDHAMRAHHGLHLPEPLRDDLVLGVEPTQGQIAAKVLARVPWVAGEAVNWATSVEAAVLDGVSIKLEVPLQDQRVHGVLGGIQVSLPRNRRVAAGHAMHWLVEGQLHEPVFVHTLSWIAEARMAPQWSVLARLGGRLHARHGWGHTTAEAHGEPERGVVAGDLLFDLDLFWSPHHVVDVGLEGGVTHRVRGWTGGFVLPQLHLHPVAHMDLQLGAGPAWEEGRFIPEIAGRLIVAY